MRYQVLEELKIDRQEIVLLQALTKSHSIFSTNSLKSGISLYWNDEKLIVEPYDKITKHYFCGRELLRFDCNKTLVYSAIIVDYSECLCSNVYSDGEIENVFNFDAKIDNKQRAGGQSAARFARIRDGQIIQYFKKINEHLKKIDNELYVGMSSIYYKRFYNILNTYNKEKIIERRNIEYSGIIGMQQFIKQKETKNY